MEVILTHPSARLPTRATAGSVGYDLTSIENFSLSPGETRIVSTGVQLNKLPHGTYARIAPRSGLSLRNGIMVNAGVIDPDYRGEIKVILIGGEGTFAVGQKIAQIIIEKCETPSVIRVSNANATTTTRNDDGFGSSGM